MQFRVTVDAEGFVALVGIDAAGAVTAYVPSAGAARAIGPERPLAPEVSHILDDTLGPETFIAVVCAEPYTVDQAVTWGREALAATGGDVAKLEGLPVYCGQSTLSIHKVATAP